MSDIKFAEVANNRPKFLEHPVTKEKIYFRGAREEARSAKPIEKRGMLIVTTFCQGDIPLLEKRLEWMSHLKFTTGFDLLLIGDGDVDDFTLEKMAEGHKPFFKQVETRKILDGNEGLPWPGNVNSAFQKTARILRGEYGTNKFSWLPYSSWFNLESDVLPLKSDTFERLSQSYLKGAKPFWGYISDTKDNSGKVHRHMNGAAIYPARKDREGRWYNAGMMLAKNIPWDVAGMQDMTMCCGAGRDLYTHCFGTRSYVKNGDSYTAVQRLHDGSESTKTIRIPETALLHHGCKDGSLVDLLMGKGFVQETTKNEGRPVDQEIKISISGNPLSVQFSPPSVIENQVRSDKAAGMKWKELISKYKLSPKKLKEILG